MARLVANYVNFCDRINEFDVVKLLSVTVVCYLSFAAGGWKIGYFKEKRSSPLISTGALSSEGLCYGILGSLRQETSALIATHRRDCANLPLACCACTPDSHRLARPTAHMALAQ